MTATTTTTSTKPLHRLARPITLLALTYGLTCWHLGLANGGRTLYLGALFGYLPSGILGLALWWLPALLFFTLILLAWLRRSLFFSLTALFMPITGIILYMIRYDLRYDLLF